MQRAEGEAGKSAGSRVEAASPFPVPLNQGTSQQPGVRRGTGSAGQPREEEEAVAPSHSPERRCYIYLPADLGLSLSPVTQALQPARIQGDGTFRGKNNPPAAGERAGVEVTDWTAAPSPPLPGEQPSGSAVPRDGELAHTATAPAPCPGGWGQS